jgi:hypothetical protein
MQAKTATLDEALAAAWAIEVEEERWTQPPYVVFNVH